MHKGIIASPGIAIGKAFVLDQQEVAVKKREISEAEIEQEVARFKEALRKTEEELLDTKEKVSHKLGAKHARIFDAYLLILEDPVFVEETIQRIRKNALNVEYVFTQSLEKIVKVFNTIDDEYLKERSKDIQNLGKRVLKYLIGDEKETLAHLEEQVIVVATDLTPSDTVAMREENVLGFATDRGGRTSHTTIMAQSLEIPAVVGLKDITQKVLTGDVLILDGNQGMVIVNPDEAALKEYRKEQRKLKQEEKELKKLKSLEAKTLDGYKVEMMANIEVPEEIESVIKHGAGGIGLYRTEFLYLNRSDMPSEEEQWYAYKKVAKAMYPFPVVIRTIDVGGDKFLSSVGTPQEINPFLGLRAIRLCLKHTDIFKSQLRAILRASALGNVKIMYPMISGIEELQKSNQILKEVKEELLKERVPFDHHIQVGAMIEIPSAALTAEVLAQEADFFSIGTNDLIQYTMAVDRVNESVAYLYEPLHPAVLALIKRVIDAAHKENKKVAVCGEMAGDPAATMVLLGLGLDEFSMGPTAVPKIKKIIRSVTRKEAVALTRQILNQPNTAAIKKLIKQQVDLDKKKTSREKESTGHGNGKT
ncbi:MAG: phosphoenolpyruvate--protein phosphotransferase [bacterium]